MIRRQWAQGDANAAERWARGLADPAARDGALGGVFAGAVAAGSVNTRILDAIGSDRQREQAVMNSLSTWAQRDPVAATVDLSVFSALSSDAARQTAAMRIVVPLVRRDAGQARAIMDAYVTDPAMRRTIEQQIERAQAAPATSNFILN